MGGFVPVVFTTAVIDSGVLFTALTINYVERAHLPEAKGSALLAKTVHRELCASAHLRHAYLQLLNGVRNPLITSHVVGELQGLQTSRSKLRGEDLRFFWVHSLEFLLARNFDERLLRLMDMNDTGGMREALCAIGPADTGLISLALSAGCPLVTDDDRTLAWRARYAGVDCHLARLLIGNGTSNW